MKICFLAGINGLIEFRSEAAKRDWKILSVQHFEVTSGTTPIDVSSQLNLIKNIGTVQWLMPNNQVKSATRLLPIPEQGFLCFKVSGW